MKAQVSKDKLVEKLEKMKAEAEEAEEEAGYVYEADVAYGKRQAVNEILAWLSGKEATPEDIIFEEK